MKFKTEVIRKEIDNCQLPGPEVALQMCDKIDRLEALLVRTVIYLVVLNESDLISEISEEFK
jgi:hypothetical protein